MTDAIIYTLAVLGLIPAAAIVLVVVAIAWGLVAALWRTLTDDPSEEEIRQIADQVDLWWMEKRKTYPEKRGWRDG